MNVYLMADAMSKTNGMVDRSCMMLSFVNNVQSELNNAEAKWHNARPE